LLHIFYFTMTFKRMAIVCLSLGNLHCLEESPKDIWDDVKNGVKNIFDDISDIELRELIDTLKDGGSDVLDWLDKQLGLLNEDNLEKLLNKIQYTKVKDWVVTHSTMTYQELQDLMNMIHTNGKDHAQKVQKFIDDHIVDEAATALDWSVNELQDLVEDVSSDTTDLADVVLQWVNDQVNQDNEKRFKDWIDTVEDISEDVWTLVSGEANSAAKEVHAFIRDDIDEVLDWSTNKLKTVVDDAVNASENVADAVLEWLNENMNETKFTNWIKDGHKMAEDELSELWTLINDEADETAKKVKDHIHTGIDSAKSSWANLKTQMQSLSGDAAANAADALDWLADNIQP